MDPLVMSIILVLPQFKYMGAGCLIPSTGTGKEGRCALPSTPENTEFSPAPEMWIYVNNDSPNQSVPELKPWQANFWAVSTSKYLLVHDVLVPRAIYS